MRKAYVVKGFTNEEAKEIEKNSAKKYMAVECGDKLFIRLNWIDIHRLKKFFKKNDTPYLIRSPKNENQLAA